MKATYAHELAMSFKEKRFALAIFEQIERAARGGGFYITMDRAATPDERAQLEFNGFSIIEKVYLNGQTESYISW